MNDRADRSLFDEAHLGLVRDCLSDDEFREVLEALSSTMASKIADIRDAIARGDLEGVRTSAHRLKGDAANLGARAVVTAATRINTAQALDQARPAIDDLADAAAATDTVIQRQIMPRTPVP